MLVAQGAATCIPSRALGTLLYREPAVIGSLQFFPRYSCLKPALHRSTPGIQLEAGA